MSNNLYTIRLYKNDTQNIDIPETIDIDVNNGLTINYDVPLLDYALNKYYGIGKFVTVENKYYSAIRLGFDMQLYNKITLTYNFNDSIEIVTLEEFINMLRMLYNTKISIEKLEEYKVKIFSNIVYLNIALRKTLIDKNKLLRTIVLDMKVNKNEK